MSLNPPPAFEHHQVIMEGLRKVFILLLIASVVHQAPASLALGNKVLHIPEKIIGGVIDIVHNHKNKPAQQSTFQQSVQTQTTFSQQGNVQAAAGNGQWTGPAYQGAGFQGQTQFQAQGQVGYGSQGAGTQGTLAPAYPVNNGLATGASGSYPTNTSPYPQQSFSQSQNQGQFQNNQNQYQNQNQNQHGNFQEQSQNQVQNQNGLYQTGQYGSGNSQGTGQYAPSNGNYQIAGAGGSYQNGQSGNYHGTVPQTGGNYQTGQTSGGNYQTGNYQNVQTGNGQYQGSNGQFSHNQGNYVQTGQNQSGHYGSQTTNQSQSGSHTGSSGSQSGFQTSQQTGGQGQNCVCQSWTKPPEFQPLSDEPPKPDRVESKPDDKKPIV